MAKQPLVMVEFTKSIDEMDDAEIDALAGDLADAMAANLAALPPTD